jgi:hypothetical protein
VFKRPAKAKSLGTVTQLLSLIFTEMVAYRAAERNLRAMRLVFGT